MFARPKDKTGVYCRLRAKLRMAVCAICVSFGLNLFSDVAFADRITVQAAYDAAKDGRIDLIDIRRPSEWAKTGVPDGATPITMHQGLNRFVGLMKARQAANGGRPVALICRAGVRSKRMHDRLKRAGVKVIDVSAGLSGNRRGDTGWVRAGLPVRKWSPKE